jgi:hypothetical protein
MGKKFFKHIVVTFAIALIGATASYYFICNGLSHTTEFFPGRLNHILYDTTHYDAVFMGTSRVANNIDPLIFDSITHLTSYNAGMEGASYTAVDLFTRRFVANHHPAYVFINIDIYTMEKENSLYDFPQYYPHLQDSDIAVLSDRKQELSLGKYAPFIAVSYIDDYLKGVALNEAAGIYPKDDITYSHKGFSPAGTNGFHGISAAFPLSFSYDTANFKKLDALCCYCIDHHCKVIFIMAPIYSAAENENINAAGFYRQLSGIELKQAIKEINFYTDHRFTKDMFANRTHLNGKGAIFYTHLLADSFIAR